MKIVIYLIAINVLKVIISFVVISTLFTSPELESSKSTEKLNLHPKYMLCKFTEPNITLSDTQIEKLFQLPVGVNISVDMQILAKCRTQLDSSGVPEKDCLCFAMYWIWIAMVLCALTAVGSTLDLVTAICDENRDFTDSQQDYFASTYSWFFFFVWLSMAAYISMQLTMKWNFLYTTSGSFDNSEHYFKVPSVYAVANGLSYSIALLYGVDGAVMMSIAVVTSMIKRKSRRNAENDQMDSIAKKENHSNSVSTK